VTAVLVTHTHPENASEGVRAAAKVAADLGVELVAPADEHEKHGDAAKGVGRRHRRSHSTTKDAG
jgi:hypothetical protein